MKNVFVLLLIMSDNIRLTASSFHFIQRPQFFSMGQLCLDISPFKTFMTVHIFLKTVFYCAGYLLTLFQGRLLSIAICHVSFLLCFRDEGTGPLSRQGACLSDKPLLH